MLPRPTDPSDAPASMRRAQQRAARAPLFLLLLAMVLYFLRFGYVFGDGDQDELVPAAIHLLDSRYFATDWLVQHVVSGVNVRSAFVALLAASGLVTPIWLGAAVLHVVVWMVVAASVYALAFDITSDEIASALGMLVAVVVTPVMTLGGNAIVHNALLPEGVAWALALPGVLFFLRQRWMPSALCLGAASWFHLLVGGLTWLILVLILVWRATEAAPGYGRAGALRFAGVFLLASLPLVIPVLASQGGAAPESESPFYIHAVFRNPWHHLFFSFDTARHLRFWPLMLGGALARWRLGREGAVRFAPEIGRLWLITAALCGVSIVFVELVPVELVAKLQLFKLTVPSALLASLLLSAAVVTFLPDRLRESTREVLRRRTAGLAAVLVTCVLVLAVAVSGMGRPGAMLYPLRHGGTPLGAVEAWAREATDPSVVFAIPPSVGSFRSFAKRSVVANWNAFVFDDRAMQVWFERLQAVAPIGKPPRGSDPRGSLDSAYHANSVERWLELDRRFGIDYVLTRKHAARLGLPVAFENDGWVIHTLDQDDQTGDDAGASPDD